MEDKIPDEQQNKLLPFLQRLADTISNDGDIDKASDDILRIADLGMHEAVDKQLNNWIKVLQEYHINPGSNQREYLARLSELGIPSDLAELALARIRETVPSDIEFELRRCNYVRAVLLAQQEHYPQEKIHHLKELALRQYAADYRNLPGFQRLVKEWEIPQNEIKKILDQLLEETRTYANSEASLQFDVHTMQHLTLSQWIQNVLESSRKL
jgi:hypothetical protein